MTDNEKAVFGDMAAFLIALCHQMPVRYKGDDLSWAVPQLYRHGGKYFADVDIGETTLKNVGVNVVYHEGGYEGGGEHAERIFEVVENASCTPNNVLVGNVLGYIRVVGFYSSYEDSKWFDNPESLHRVYPKQVMVTQYTQEA